MAEYDNSNRGTLSVNERKTLPTHPDYSGSINIEGKEYWLSGWEKTAQRGQNAGKSFLSLSVKPKEAQQAGYAPSQAPKPSFRRDPAPSQAREPARPSPAKADDDEALPF